MAWEPAERVQKNAAGEYRALIGGEWVPVAKAQKSASGAYRVDRAASMQQVAPVYDEQAELKKIIEAEPVWKQKLLAAGAGLVKTGLGVKQLLSDLTPDQQYAVQAATAFQEQAPYTAAAGDIAAMAIPGAAVARYAKAAPKLAAAGRALVLPKTAKQAAGAGAAYMGLQPTQGADVDIGEKAGQVALGGVSGLAGYGLLKGAGRVFNPSVSPEVAALQAEGITPTVGQILGGGAKKAEEALRSTPILGDVITKAHKRGVEDFNRAAINRALNPVGESIGKNEPVGYKAIENAYHTISGKYDDLLPKLKISADQQFQTELSSLKELAQNLNPAQAQQFNSVLENEVLKKFTSSGIMSGETMKQIESKLGQLSRNYMKDADYDKQLLGNALKEAQDTLRRMVERNNPQYAGELSKINQAYANLLRVENAAAKSGAKEGIFTPAQLESASRALDASGRKRASAHGKALMQDLATSGQSVLAQQLPESGTAPRLMYGLSGLGGGAAYLTGGIPALIAGGAGIGLGSALYTQPVQRTLAAALTKRPELVRQVGNRLSDLAQYGALPTVGVAQGMYE